MLCAAAACRRGPFVSRNAPVILIVVDTLRADHLPAYGYRGVATPSLDALAKDSLVFDNAVSHVPLTLASHATLMTGLLPFQNGVRDNLGYRLSPGHETLAALLKKRGFATGAAVSSVVLDRSTGMGAGFDFYDDQIELREAGEVLGRVQRPGPLTLKRLEDWMAKQTADKPLFAFLHIYEPHAPYEPPEPFRSVYRERPYDGEVAASDAVVGDFIAFLKKRGLYDGALVVFLSDHGEGLGEHGEDEHGIFLYRETTRVPLFVKLPGGGSAGRRVTSPAGISDVLPTILAVLGEKPSRAGGPGISLLALADAPSNRRIYSETVYPRFHFGWSDLASLTNERYQYIHAPRPELFDFLADPTEKENLAAGLPPAFRSMRAELVAMNRPMEAPGTADPEAVKKLASLGYIGAAAASADDKDLPDPKDKIRTVDLLKSAGSLLERHREDEAIVLLRTVAKENPRMIDTWEMLSRALRKAGRPAEAREALKEADRLSPATPQILLGLSGLSLETGDIQAAGFYAEAARVAGSRDAHGQLAEIALARGDLPAARREAEAARAERPSSPAPLLVLARIESKAGDFAAALADLDEAARLAGADGGQAPMNLQSARGDALAHLKREAEAEAAFQAEIQAYPDNLEAWQRLGLLYAAQGRTGELRSLLTKMTAQIPTRRAYEAAARVCEIVGDVEGSKRWKALASRASGGADPVF